MKVSKKTKTKQNNLPGFRKAAPHTQDTNWEKWSKIISGSCKFYPSIGPFQHLCCSSCASSSLLLFLFSTRAPKLELKSPDGFSFRGSFISFGGFSSRSRLGCLRRWGLQGLRQQKRDSLVTQCEKVWSPAQKKKRRREEGRGGGEEKFLASLLYMHDL